MKSEILPITLTPEQIAKLEALARSQDRTAVQQARYVLKRYISRYPDPTPEPELAGVANK